MAQNPIRSVIVAGAAGHLGKNLTHQLLTNGKRVVAFCENKTQQENLEKELGTNENYICIQGNLSVSKDVTHMMNEAFIFLGSIDAVISTAGAFRYAGVEDSSEQDYDVLFNSNIKSSWLLAQAALPYMKKSKQGRLLFMSAKATQAGGAEGMSLYLASKAALNMFVLCLAREIREFGITVNAIMPTIIDTPTNRKDMPDADITKWVAADELARFLVALLGPEFATMNGSLVSAPGKL